MKTSKKLTNRFKKTALSLSGLLLSTSVFAEDKLAGALSGEVKEMFGSEGTFWKLFVVAVSISVQN